MNVPKYVYFVVPNNYREMITECVKTVLTFILVPTVDSASTTVVTTVTTPTMTDVFVSATTTSSNSK